jgi:hypothetical protein
MPPPCCYTVRCNERKHVRPGTGLCRSVHEAPAATLWLAQISSVDDDADQWQALIPDPSSSTIQDQRTHADADRLWRYDRAVGIVTLASCWCHSSRNSVEVKQCATGRTRVSQNSKRIRCMCLCLTSFCLAGWQVYCVCHSHIPASSTKMCMPLALLGLVLGPLPYPERRRRGRQAVCFNAGADMIGNAS